MAHNLLSVSSAEYNSHHLHLVIQFSAAIRKRKKKFFFFKCPKKFGKIKKKRLTSALFACIKNFLFFVTHWDTWLNTCIIIIKHLQRGKQIIIIEIFLENCNEYICKKKHFTLRKRKTTFTRNTMHQISYFFK